MLSRPSTNAMGTVARSTARPRSATMRIRRRGRRSTQTPANKLNSAVGAAATAASTPISTGPGVQRDHGGERQGEERDLVAEVRNGLADPELQEFAVAPQAGHAAERRAAARPQGDWTRDRRCAVWF